MSRNLWWGLVASVLIIVVAVGLLRLLDDDDLRLPDEFDGLIASDSPAAYDDLDEDRADQILETQRDAVAYNDAKTSEAFDGAAVSSRVYRNYGAADDDQPRQITVWAVAADAGPLLPAYGFGDPDVLGYALPTDEWSEHGDVECLGTRLQPPRAGDDYDEEEAAIDVVTCQRRSGSLTVRVTTRDTPVGDVVDLTEDLWDDVS